MYEAYAITKGECKPDTSLHQLSYTVDGLVITSYTPSILYSIWLIGKMPEGQNRKFNVRKVECDGSST